MADVQTLRQDPYPSRTAERPKLIDRVDPVVYGSADDGPLTPDQVATFDRDGALMVEGLFDGDDLARLRARLDRLVADPMVRADERTIIELEHDEVRSIFEVHRSDEVFAEVASDPRVADVARQLLGSEVYIHQSRINLKPGFAGSGFWWHSDFETWHAEDGMPRMRAISASITLTDNYPYNGPLIVMAGSHRTFVSTVGETPEDHYKHSLRKQEIGVPDEDSLRALAQGAEMEQMVGPAGSVIFFDCNIMHGSGGNITPFPRSNVFLVFNSVENALEEPYAATEPRPNFIAAREVVPVPRR
jgi:ectoine hydroxylase